MHMLWRWLIGLACLSISSSISAAGNADIKLVFVGDILLAREVQREIEVKNHMSPWRGMGTYFADADLVVGNLEGSVGEAEDCLKLGDPLCFAVKPASLGFAKSANFTALSVENNHSGDLGDAGRSGTQAALKAASIMPINFAESPTFTRIKNETFAFIALNTVKGADGRFEPIPSPMLRQKIRLAKSLASWVVVYVHWGVELADWIQPQQKAMAQWLTEQGADLIIGSHPHVMESTECVNGRPVFYSLGNHVFDQKYPATKDGMIAECFVKDGALSCDATTTHTPAASAFPVLGTKASLPDITALRSCKVQGRKSLELNGFRLKPLMLGSRFTNASIILEGWKDNKMAWNVAAKHILSLEPAQLDAGDSSKVFLFSLEQHLSSIDQEVGPRPYVYEVTPHGLVAKWRGSALAWPLIDAKVIKNEAGLDFICALHRSDSFLLLNPVSKETRTIVYKWNGFGFSGMEDEKLSSTCRSYFNNGKD